MATWACGHRAIQSNEIAAGRKRKIMMEAWWEGERAEAEMSGWKYDITLYTSTGPWQQSNTLDLRSSLSRFFQLVKTEAGGPLEKETCLDCLHVVSICSVHTQSVNRLDFWICCSWKPSLETLSSPLEVFCADCE